MKIVQSFKEIKCPITHKIEKIYFRKITGTVLVEIYGCDNSNGCAECQQCLNKLLEELTSG